MWVRFPPRVQMEKEAVVVIIRNECGEYLGILSKEKGLGFPGGGD